MPIVVKSRRDDSTDNVIKKFKKLSVIENVVGKARDREFYKKPALLRKEHNKELERLKRREKHLRQISAK